MMKFGMLIHIVIVSIILAGVVHAQEIEITIYDTLYGPGETVQAEIILNNPEKPLAPSQIKLVNEFGTIMNMAPFLSEIEKNHYFVYFDVPLLGVGGTLKDGLYYVRVDKALFVLDGVLTEVTEDAEMMVQSNPPLVSVSPGGVQLRGEENAFSVKMVNTEGSVDIFVDTSQVLSHPYVGAQLINEGTTRTFKFTVDRSVLEESVKEIVTLTYGSKSYEVPVWIQVGKEDVTQVLRPLEIVGDVQRIDRTLLHDQRLRGSIMFKNNLDELVEGITASVTGDLAGITTLQLESSTLGPGETALVSLVINDDRNLWKDEYTGEVVIRSGEYGASVPVKITVEQETVDGGEDITIDVQEPPVETEKDEFGVLEPFNFTQIEDAEQKKTQLWMGIAVVLLIIIAILYYLSRKKITKRRGFGELVSDIEKRR